MVVRTVERRGKSEIPWSRIEIELSRSWREDFREPTEAERAAAEAWEFIVIFCVLIVGLCLLQALKKEICGVAVN